MTATTDLSVGFDNVDQGGLSQKRHSVGDSPRLPASEETKMTKHMSKKDRRITELEA